MDGTEGTLANDLIVPLPNLSLHAVIRDGRS